MSAVAAAAGPAPWRNNSLVMGGGRDPPLSDQGDTIIGVYLLLLGGYTHTQRRKCLDRLASVCLCQGSV